MEVPGTPIKVSVFTFELKLTGKDSADPNQHEFLHHIVKSNWNEFYMLSGDLRPWWRKKVRPEIIQMLTKSWNISNKKNKVEKHIIELI